MRVILPTDKRIDDNEVAAMVLNTHILPEISAMSPIIRRRFAALRVRQGP